MRKLGEVITAQDMRLRDVVRFKGNASAFHTCSVIKSTEKAITLHRVYVTTSAAETTAGVIPMIGVEEYTIYRDSSLEYILLEQNEVV